MRKKKFGNTCYVNSVLQALYFCKPFREKIIQYKLAYNQRISSLSNKDSSNNYNNNSSDSNDTSSHNYLNNGHFNHINGNEDSINVNTVIVFN